MEPAGASRSPFRRREWALFAAFAAALVVLLVAAVLAYRSERRLLEAARWSRHAAQVLGQARRVTELLAAEGSGGRGFALSGDESFLERFGAAERELPAELDRLADLVADDPEQQRRVERLRPLVRARQEAVRELIAARRSGGLAAATDPDLLRRGREAMDAVLEVHGELESEERRLQAERDRRVAADTDAHNAYLLGLSLLGVTLVALSFVGLLREVRRRRRAEREVERLFELTPDLLAICGLDGVFRRVNPAWDRTLGYGLEVLTRVPFLDLVHPEDRERTQEAFAVQLEGGSVRGFENRYRHADGSWRWLQWSSIPDRATGLLYAVARDVTAQKAAVEELERARRAAETASRELEAFSYSVSHDLRAPLRAIDGFSLILLEDFGDRLEPEARDHLARVRAASQKMAGLIDDLLRLSRVSRGELTLRPVDLSALAREVGDALAQGEPGRRTRLEVEPGLTAHADEALLRVALTNLLGNAWKFTRGRDPGVVRFGAESRDGEAVWFVADDGAGFDMRYADKLFTPFQRLHGADEFEGSGIGLAIVARVVARHGGRVWAQSAPGQGATFSFTLGPAG
jgi:PAS domain S-box-containing protein